MRSVPRGADLMAPYTPDCTPASPPTISRPTRINPVTRRRIDRTCPVESTPALPCRYFSIELIRTPNLDRVASAPWFLGPIVTVRRRSAIVVRPACDIVSCSARAGCQGPWPGSVSSGITPLGDCNRDLHRVSQHGAWLAEEQIPCCLVRSEVSACVGRARGSAGPQLRRPGRLCRGHSDHRRE